MAECGKMEKEDEEEDAEAGEEPTHELRHRHAAPHKRHAGKVGQDIEQHIDAPIKEDGHAVESPCVADVSLEASTRELGLHIGEHPQEEAGADEEIDNGEEHR